MSLTERLEEPRASGCKVCDILTALVDVDPAEVDAARTMLCDWPHVAVAEAFTGEGYPVSEKTVREHRRKGHSNGIQ